MSTGSKKPERGPFLRWVIATTLGWLLGFVFVIALALLWETIGGRVQFIVGVGMGAGVGYMQSRMIGEWVEPRRRWVWASTVGMGVPFLLWDLGSVIGLDTPLPLPLCVLTGSVLVGVLQRRLLRPRFERATWWVPACVVGWGLPAGAIALGESDFQPAVTSALAIVAMFSGGAVVGVVTGKALVWMSPSPAGIEQTSDGSDSALRSDEGHPDTIDRGF